MLDVIIDYFELYVSINTDQEETSSGYCVSYLTPVPGQLSKYEGKSEIILMVILAVLIETIGTMEGCDAIDNLVVPVFLIILSTCSGAVCCVSLVAFIVCSLY